MENGYTGLFSTFIPDRRSSSIHPRHVRGIEKLSTSTLLFIMASCPSCYIESYLKGRFYSVLVASTLVSCQGTDEGTVNAEEPSTRPPLTGNPQIDYIWDPNLPRELNGFNMSTYPFLRSVPPPDKMDFKCDGRHDGFYASVPHKCQVKLLSSCIMKRN